MLYDSDEVSLRVKGGPRKESILLSSLFLFIYKLASPFSEILKSHMLQHFEYKLS